MTKTKIIVSEQKLEKSSADLLVFGVVQGKKGGGKSEITTLRPWLRELHKVGDFSAKVEEIFMLYPNVMQGTKFAASRMLFVGLGKCDEKDGDVQLELMRKVGGTIAKAAAKSKAIDVAVHLPFIKGVKASQLACSITEGILLGDYKFLKYKKKDKKDPAFSGIEKLVFSGDVGLSSIRRGARLGEVAALAACKARDMANEPGNGWRPVDFANYAKDLSEDFGLKCQILELSDMKRLKMGGILGVNQGSAEPPKLIVLEYRPKKKSETLLLVGKGLTFDSGGISIKAGAGMQDMKYDMCGGAAVISVMQAIARLKPGVGVTAIVPSTDNMSGSNAYKPGDIIRHYGGTTSEIINTDAEGRLILADALAYGIKKFKPACVVDLATLTGAVIVGLGHHRTGLLSNNDHLARQLLQAGERSGELLWRLPLGKEYSDQLKSDVADIKNTGGMAAGTITAAAYLQHFVGDIPWAHLDIAGTAWGYTKKSFVPNGPSGIGVRTLLEFVLKWKDNM